MQTGLQTIALEDGSSAIYYFGTDGVMKTGKQTIFSEEEGINQTWYAPVSFDGKSYLVSTAGTIQKATGSSKSSVRPELGSGFRDFKDLSEFVWTVDVNGIIQ